MRNGFYFFLLFGLLFTIFTCTKQVNTSKNRPLPVVFIPGSAETAVVERGIDAVPEGDNIRLEWRASPEEEVIGYQIRRSRVRESGFDLVAYVTVPDTTYIDETVQVDERYYYYIQAVTDENVESDPSDTLDYKLILKATDITPRGQISETRPELGWKDPNVPTEAFYVVRVKEADSNAVVWISVVPSSYSDRESVLFNADGTAEIDSLIRGMDYQWRVDIVGSEDHTGSESEWISIQCL